MGDKRYYFMWRSSRSVNFYAFTHAQAEEFRRGYAPLSPPLSGGTATLEECFATAVNEQRRCFRWARSQGEQLRAVRQIDAIVLAVRQQTKELTTC